MIQEHIKKPLAEELLFGKLVKGGAVKVTLKDGKLDFEYHRGGAAGAARPELRRGRAGARRGGGDVAGGPFCFGAGDANLVG